MSRKIEVILTDTRHAGNIGAVCRLMKNLNLTGLTLVNPTHRGHIEAVKMAVGAEELIENAKIVETLAEAISGCADLYAVTRRPRRMRKNVYNPAKASIKISAALGVTGVIFGSEKFGLTNEQVALAGSIITIPVAPAHPSYNLAQAAAIVLYGIASPSLAIARQSKKSKREPAEAHERRLLYDQITNTARAAGFFGRSNDAKVTAAIEDIFERAQLDKKDVKILQGLFKQMGRGAPGSKKT